MRMNEQPVEADFLKVIPLLILVLKGNCAAACREQSSAIDGINAIGAEGNCKGALC